MFAVGLDLELGVSLFFFVTMLEKLGIPATACPRVKLITRSPPPPPLAGHVELYTGRNFPSPARLE